MSTPQLQSGGSVISSGTYILAGMALVAGAIAFSIQAAAVPSLMTRADNSSARTALQTAYGAALDACDVRGHDAPVCAAAARGENRYQRAELESRYRGTAVAASAALAAHTGRAINHQGKP
jgi:hypothetical protein